jgi:hypothetical protein
VFETRSNLPSSHRTGKSGKSPFFGEKCPRSKGCVGDREVTSLAKKTLCPTSPTGAAGTFGLPSVEVLSCGVFKPLRGAANALRRAGQRSRWPSSSQAFESLTLHTPFVGNGAKGPVSAKRRAKSERFFAHEPKTPANHQHLD